MEFVELVRLEPRDEKDSVLAVVRFRSEPNAKGQVHNCLVEIFLDRQESYSGLREMVNRAARTFLLKCADAIQLAPEAHPSNLQIPDGVIEALREAMKKPSE